MKTMGGKMGAKMGKGGKAGMVKSPMMSGAPKGGSKTKKG